MPPPKTGSCVLAVARLSAGFEKEDSEAIVRTEAGRLVNDLERNGPPVDGVAAIQVRVAERAADAGFDADHNHRLWQYFKHADFLVVVRMGGFAVDLETWSRALPHALNELQIIFSDMDLSLVSYCFVLQKQDIVRHVRDPHVFFERDPGPDHPFYFWQATRLEAELSFEKLVTPVTLSRRADVAFDIRSFRFRQKVTHLRSNLGR